MLIMTNDGHSIRVIAGRAQVLATGVREDRRL